MKWRLGYHLVKILGVVIVGAAHLAYISKRILHDPLMRRVFWSMKRLIVCTNHKIMQNVRLSSKATDSLLKGGLPDLLDG